MNELGVEVLVAAALRGDRQIRGAYRDERGGYCALGKLASAVPGLLVWADQIMWADQIIEGDRMPARNGIVGHYGLSTTPMLCPECDDYSKNEHVMIIHLNDTHRWDFLTIARKLGPSGTA